MHSIIVVYELSRDCNLILTMWLDEITVPLTPEIETFNGRVSKPRISTNFLDMKFACDPQSNKARHALREPSSSQTSITAVESMTCSPLNDPEAWLARTEGRGVALDATSLSVLLVDESAAESIWSSVLWFVWQTLHWLEVHLLDAWKEELKQLTQNLRLRISAALCDTGSATKFLQ